MATRMNGLCAAAVSEMPVIRTAAGDLGNQPVLIEISWLFRGAMRGQIIGCGNQLPAVGR